MPITAFDDLGKGPALVLLHAFPLSRAMWEAQRNGFPGRRLIAPDLPGFGGSPRRPEGLTMEAAAREVAALLDRLGVKGPAAVLGLSMGGYVALEFARLFPERLGALILACTRSGADSPEGAQGRYQTAQRARSEGLAFLADTMPARLLGRTSAAHEPGLAGRLRDLILANEPGGIADALVGMAQRRDLTPLLPRLSLPVLALAGEEDTLIPPAEAQAIARAVPGASLKLLPGCGHLPNLEAPEAFRDAVSSFLGT